MKNIKYTLTIICHFFVSGIIAQINVNLALNSQPPSYLSDWGGGRAGQLIVSNMNMPQRVFQAKIFTTLTKENGEIIATSNNNTAQTITFNIGANVIGMDRVIQLGNLTFIGENNALTSSGKLLPGLYTLNVTLVNPDSFQPLSNLATKMFTQINYQLPYLLSPPDEAELDVNIAQSIIIFRWSSLVPLPREIGANYKLQVFEILENQTPMQALRSNQPILLTTVRTNTQYIWRPQMYLKDSLHQKFIWTIETTDLKGNSYNSSSDNNLSYSEPRTFSIINKKKNGSN